jgi:hypothetical protein
VSALFYSHSKLSDHTNNSYANVQLEKPEMPFPFGLMISINVLDQALDHTADRKVSDVREIE